MSDKQTWTIIVSQNSWEYAGYVYIKADSIEIVGKNSIIADGVHIEFDEEIEVKP